MLQLYGLTGNDRFVNLIHFACYAGSALAASSVARLLGARTLGQILSAVFSLTIPQGILTASGAKNDFALAFWILTAAYFAIRYLQHQATQDAVFFALASGLSILTKGTAYLWLPPLVLAIFASQRHPGLIALLRCLPLLGAACLILNLGHYTRNFSTFGSPWGCDAAYCGSEFKFLRADFGPRGAAANLLRNLVLHVTTPVPYINALAYHIAVRAIRFLGTDPQDPKSLWTGTRFEPPPYRFHEALAGNPIHLLLITAVLICLLIKNEHRRGFLWPLAIGAVLSLLAFCWIFRWQPWHTRLHLPFFVLMAPVVGKAVESLVPAAVKYTLAIALLMLSFPFALNNEMRPLASPGRNLFTVSREQLYPSADLLPALAATLRQSGCRQIGLDVLGSFQIYPLLRQLQLVAGAEAVYLTTDPRFEGWFHKRSFMPCGVIYSHCDEPARSADCRALGYPQRYGNLWLVIGFDARWSPKSGWRIVHRGTSVADARIAEAGYVLQVPATLRPDNPGDLLRLQGVASDKWVTETGFHLVLASHDLPVVGIRLKGEIPSGYPILPQGIRLWCNGAKPSRQVISKPGSFEFTTILNCLQGEVLELAVVPDKSFRPVDLGINLDPRRLSFILHEVTIFQPDSKGIVRQRNSDRSRGGFH
jgi:hypothetical protein